MLFENWFDHLITKYLPEKQQLCLKNRRWCLAHVLEPCFVSCVSNVEISTFWWCLFFSSQSSSLDSFQGYAVPTPKVPILPPVNSPKINGSGEHRPTSNMCFKFNMANARNLLFTHWSFAAPLLWLSWWIMARVKNWGQVNVCPGSCAIALPNSHTRWQEYLQDGSIFIYKKEVDIINSST